MSPVASGPSVRSYRGELGPIVIQVQHAGKTTRPNLDVSSLVWPLGCGLPAKDWAFRGPHPCTMVARRCFRPVCDLGATDVDGDACYAAAGHMERWESEYLP
jgi:hypothetical protein